VHSQVVLEIKITKSFNFNSCLNNI
jgi:hypothetical protein